MTGRCTHGSVNPNALVLGRLGCGKSQLRVDPHGECTSLVAALGGRSLRLTGGERVTFDPLAMPLIAPNSIVLGRAGRGKDADA
jgi:hypothetical protein